MNKQKQIEQLEAELAALRAEREVEIADKRQEGMRRLAQISENITKEREKGEQIAEEYGISWSLDMPYGMGGDFYPTSSENPFYGRGWQASSHSC